jgi:hypothetical protein
MARQRIRTFTNDRQIAATAGAVAGLVGGFAMILVAMIYSAIIGEGFTFPLKEIAATFLGVEAIIGGAGTIILGALTHFVVSAAWGAVFGLALPADSTSSASYGWGLAFGVGVWLVMSFVALPIFDPVMNDRVALYSGMWFAYHLVFGVVLGVTPEIARRMAAERDVYFDTYRRAA